MNIALLSNIAAPPPWIAEGHLATQDWFAKLHRGPALHVEDESGILQVAGYDAVRLFLSDPHWSSAKRMEYLPPERRPIRLLTLEAPEHGELRQYFQNAYRPARLKGIEARVESLAKGLLNACFAKGEFDVIGELAQPLTLVTISEILGIPTEEQSELRSLTKPLLLGKVDRDGTLPFGPERLFLGGKQDDFDAIDAYFTNLAVRRRKDPRDDLVSALAAIPADAFAAPVDLTTLLFEQYVAGITTTAHLLGSFLAMLDCHRDQLAMIDADRNLINSGLEETLRLHAPLQARIRVATEDFAFLGAPIAENTLAIAWLQGANLDPAQFSDPHRFDVTRSPNRHLAFGFGPHACLGMMLGRLEARMAMRIWFDLVEDFERADNGPLRWADDFIGHGLDEMPIRIKLR